MSQRITFWKMEGKSDIEISHYLLKTKADIPMIMTKVPHDADVATLDRTDKRSNIMHEIWHSKRYVDLNER